MPTITSKIQIYVEQARITSLLLTTSTYAPNLGSSRIQKTRI